MSLNSVRHHHVASLGEVRHSGRHADGRYKFALGVRETLWQWVENILASEHFEAATAVEFRDAVAKKIDRRRSTKPERGNRRCRAQQEAVAVQQNLSRAHGVNRRVELYPDETEIPYFSSHVVCTNVTSPRTSGMAS